ncbi:MAG: hypothetical protein Q7S88_02870 [Candidatus Daviesbacteria bacterium]|nr:hypothetical protein [Candidatus Daviesbacteria bacterium]
MFQIDQRSTSNEGMAFSTGVLLGALLGGVAIATLSSRTEPVSHLLLRRTGMSVANEGHNLLELRGGNRLQYFGSPDEAQAEARRFTAQCEAEVTVLDHKQERTLVRVNQESCVINPSPERR